MDCPNQSIVPMVSAIAVVSGIVLVFLLSARQRFINKKYGCSKFGGRGGYIEISSGKRMALVEFELAGGEVDLLIYPGTLKWIGPNTVECTAEERMDLMAQVTAWCKASSYKIDTGLPNAV